MDKAESRDCIYERNYKCAFAVSDFYNQKCKGKDLCKYFEACLEKGKRDKTVRTKVNNITYEIRTYSVSQSCYCSKCHRTRTGKKVVYYHDHGIERKLCERCYEQICARATEDKKENYSKKAKKVVPKKKSIIINNPMKRIQIAGNAKNSFFDFFVREREEYELLASGAYPYKLKLAKEIKAFLKKYKKEIKNLDSEEAVSFLSNEWMRQIGKGKSDSEIEEEQRIKNVLQLTQQKKIVWIEEYNSHVGNNIRERYGLVMEEGKYYFNVTGYKNANDEKKVSLELSNGEGHICSARFNHDLYKAILEVVIRKNKTENNPNMRKLGVNEKKKVIEIKTDDFIIRTSLFRCYHKDHLVEEIIGLIKVVNRQGKVEEKRVPCAYCPECKHFYILKSVYKNISATGILLCQLIDEEIYYEKGILKNFNAASESLLMRNGYNVKANNGLTDMQRQVILSNIIDNKILSPHRIVSYIDMFISQKEHMPQYRNAVDKWKKDRAFVLSYKEQDKRVVTVGNG